MATRRDRIAHPEPLPTGPLRGLVVGLPLSLGLWWLLWQLGQFVWGLVR